MVRIGSMTLYAIGHTMRFRTLFEHVLGAILTFG